MKILAFAGSNSQESINKKLIDFTVKQFPQDDIEVLDLNDYEMPIFSIDRLKRDGIPALALEFASKIDAADLLIISLAEYNSNYTVAFKNIFDWISIIKNRNHFGDKPVFLLSTATGPGGGKHVLNTFKTRAPFSGAQILESFTLPRFNENFSVDKGILDEDKNKEFFEKLQNVKTATKENQ